MPSSQKLWKSTKLTIIQRSVVRTCNGCADSPQPENEGGFCFNASDGVTLRLSVPGNVMKQQKEQQYCSSCGVRGIVGNEDTWRGHRSTYKCVHCAVHLCVRIYPGLRKSCSELWHTVSVLKPPSTPRPPTGTSQSSADKNGSTSSALPAVSSRTRQRDSTEEPHVDNAPQRRRQS